MKNRVLDYYVPLDCHSCDSSHIHDLHGQRPDIYPIRETPPRVRSTSLEAYRSLTGQETREEQVMHAIRYLTATEGYPTDQDIKRYLGWDTCRITGRRNALMEKGRIEEAGRKKNPSGKTAITWREKFDK